MSSVLKKADKLNLSLSLSWLGLAASDGKFLGPISQIIEELVIQI